MSSSATGSTNSKESVEKIFERDLPPSSSSEEPPIEEWSSLIRQFEELKPKMMLSEQGLYDQGSGDLCAKYIAMSDSVVPKHVYYKYPGLKDPGIEDALLLRDIKKEFDIDGQDLYLALCKDMNIAPVKKFHRGLLKQTIDLGYYCVNPVGVRAMCLALGGNQYVKKLDLTCNFLNDDACYHLGQLIENSFMLKELVLSGCRIGPSGLRLLLARLRHTALELLDLSGNNIDDSCFHHLTDEFINGAVIKRLNVSHNKLGPKSALDLAAAMEYAHKNFTHLDLSWNQLFSPRGLNKLLKSCGESDVLVELNLSWNGLAASNTLDCVLALKTLRILDLSNNRLSSEAAKVIATNLKFAKHLEVLDLSYNIFSPADALEILTALNSKAVKLKNLLMNDIGVTVEFVELLKTILSLKHRATTKITHGRVIKNYKIAMPDMRDIVLKRLIFLTTAKKRWMNIWTYFLGKREQAEMLLPREMLEDMKAANFPVDEDLVMELSKAFPGPAVDKNTRAIKLNAVIDYAKRLQLDKIEKVPPPQPTKKEPASKEKKTKKMPKK